MIYEIVARNVPHAFEEVCATMPLHTMTEESRNGFTLAVPIPSILTIKDPTQRVLTDPRRNANPFFHLFEAVWMLAGGENAEWPAQFSKNYMQYAEKNGRMHGAYGHRWRLHFGTDQILDVVEMLRADPQTRRAVINMWDPEADLKADKNDLPCNTHVYFRVLDGVLDMTVCNRSNDAIWGMLGANAVHFTMLHEIIAAATYMPIGIYRVFTNNLHVYPHLAKNFEEFWAIPMRRVIYRPGNGGMEPITTIPTLAPHEQLIELLLDCEDFVEGVTGNLRNIFMDGTVLPMAQVWSRYKEGNPKRALDRCKYIDSEDWQIACREWLQRRSIVV